jgi:lipopolysaccharide assembly protein A
MRFIYFLFLLAFAGGAALLAYENQRDVALTFFGTDFTVGVPKLVGLTYLAGMLSGWTVVGMVRRSMSRVLERPLPGERVYAGRY